MFFSKNSKPEKFKTVMGTCTKCRGSGKLPSRRLGEAFVTCDGCKGSGTVKKKIEIV